MIRKSRVKNWAVFLSILLTFTGCVSAHKKNVKSTSRLRPPVAQQRIEDLPSVTSDQKIMQELTGRIDKPFFSKSELKKQPLSTQHFYAGQKYAEQKNYIMAIKHFNSVVKNYPRSPEVKKALLAKAQIYQQMGLTEPAQLNLRMAQNKGAAKKKKIARSQEVQKIVK